MVYQGMQHTYQVFSSCEYTSLIKWTQSATFAATKLRRGMIFTRIRGGRGIVQLWAMGEKPMCLHPVWIAQLPLSYPTTTLNVLLSNWGSYCLGVGVAALSVLAHPHTPPAMEPHVRKRKQTLQDFPLSPGRCWKEKTLPHFPLVTLHCRSSSCRDGCLFILMHRLLPCLVSRS